MVQETEMYRDEDAANESKYEAWNGLEKFRVTVCNTLTEGNPLRSSRAVTDTDEDMHGSHSDHRRLSREAKLNVVRQLEPRSSTTSFLSMKP